MLLWAFFWLKQINVNGMIVLPIAAQDSDQVFKSTR